MPEDSSGPSPACPTWLHCLFFSTVSEIPSTQAPPPWAHSCGPVDFLQLLFIALPCNQGAKDHSGPGDPLVKWGRWTLTWECLIHPPAVMLAGHYMCQLSFSMCAPVFKCFPSILGFKKAKKQSALDEFGTSTKWWVLSWEVGLV